MYTVTVDGQRAEFFLEVPPGMRDFAAYVNEHHEMGQVRTLLWEMATEYAQLPEGFQLDTARETSLHPVPSSSTSSGPQMPAHSDVRRSAATPTPSVQQLLDEAPMEGAPSGQRVPQSRINRAFLAGRRALDCFGSQRRPVPTPKASNLRPRVYVVLCFGKKQAWLETPVLARRWRDVRDDLWGEHELGGTTRRATPGAIFHAFHDYEEARAYVQGAGYTSTRFRAPPSQSFDYQSTR